MIVRRTSFFLALSCLIIVPMLANKIIWLANSKKTTGTFSFQGGGNSLDQIRMTHSFLYYKLGQDTIWFEALPHLELKEGQAVPVRVRQSFRC
jgi:hypothetical protein